MAESTHDVEHAREQAAPELPQAGPAALVHAAPGAALSPGRVLALQVTAGNHAVGRILARGAAPDLPRRDAHAGVLARLPSAAASEHAARALGRAPLVTQRATGRRLHRCGGGTKKEEVVQPAIWESMDQKDYKTAQGPGGIASDIEKQSPAFGKLKAEAEKDVQQTYDKPLAIESMPAKKASAEPAHFDKGTIRVNTAGMHPAAAVVNLIFEMANASQSSRFAAVASDWDSWAIVDKSLGDYGVPESELPGEWVAEYKQGDNPNERRATVQEYYEWLSLQKARDSFTEVEPKLVAENGIPQAFYSTFGDLLELKDFATYAKVRGRSHRQGVLEALKKSSAGRKPPKKKKSSGKEEELVGLPTID